MKVGEVARHFRVSEGSRLSRLSSSAAAITVLRASRTRSQLGHRRQSGSGIRLMRGPMFEVRGSLLTRHLRRPSYPASSRRRSS